MSILKIKSFLNDNKHLFKYTFLIVFVLLILLLVMQKSRFAEFINSLELKSFDFRQSVLSSKRYVSDEIKIVTVDDESYEYLIDKYGQWPIPRHIYAEILDYIESQKPSVVGFDLLFVPTRKNNKISDDKLGAAFAKYDNAFAAMSFDNVNFSVRKPPVLPQTLSNEYRKGFIPGNLYQNVKVYKNCRTVIPQILNVTDNIGHINTSKDDDGITRKVTIRVAYPKYESVNGKYYKTDLNTYDNLSYKMYKKYRYDLWRKEIIKYDVEYDDKVQEFLNYPLVLNWYGDTGLEDEENFQYIPMKKVIESMENGEDKLPDDTFKDKIVFVGTSVFSLSDIKSVPTSKYMPEVEIQATLFNNLSENSFIKPVKTITNVFVSIMLAAVVAFVCFYFSSVITAAVISVVLVSCYLAFSVLIMYFQNIWIWAVLPVILTVISVIAVYITKYILKSRDFDLTYKLATTDGLTDLYNHRFFQEQMKLCIDDCKRYNRNFSLIMTDIDFFKKFNDTYGHQAGDAVLRGVAHTLKRNVRSSDIVCRYGGEEMAIILKNTGYDEAELIANKICKTIAERPFKIAANTEKQVTISVGFSTYPMCGLETQELIEFADKGLYAAKENGRNQVGHVDLP